MRQMHLAREAKYTELYSCAHRFDCRHATWSSLSDATYIRGASRAGVDLNSSEPFVRQRFSLAHELKHIIDHLHVDLIYQNLPAHQRHTFAEAVCNYFAGCLLMPRPWVKRAYAKTQRLDRLARHFHVSQAAMATRLNQIGLTEPQPRCTPLYSGDWLDPSDLARRITRYERSTDHGPLIPELLTAGGVPRTIFQVPAGGNHAHAHYRV